MKYSKQKVRLINELHAPARKNFLRCKVVMKGLNETWQVDLVDLQKYAKINKNNKYILTIIDILSKFAYTVPLKTKTGKEVANAFSSIFEKGVIPSRIHSDRGGEFFNTQVDSLFKKHNIKLYLTYNGLEASIVERFNKTLKDKLYRMFSLQGYYKWIDELQNLVSDYNATIDSTIKVAPKDVDEKKAKILVKTVFNYNNNIKNNLKSSKFKIGDFVRVSKYKHLFEKSFTPNLGVEIFKVNKVRNTNPYTYYLIDYQNNPILGAFYEYELQKVKYPNVYLIEKIFKKTKNKAFVKYLGFKEKSWIPIHGRY